ncbi:MAG: CTP synthase [bacterium]|nr:CTP synthase [bacterium]MDZ4231826.1 CTP synthase [Candidatus Pacearchaeota archaeon]
MATKYIFVAGGVMSGVGKGVTTASVGTILHSMGYEVSCVKIDPYINVDAGTMNPLEHGETFVTNDGTECDQDIGNYERFLNRNLAKVNYMTTGSVYLSVINRERNLEYKGKCVEVVPHIPLEVISRIKKAAATDKADFLLIEIGGTVGEYQNMLFLEAVRMMKLADPGNVMLLLVSYLPIPRTIGEMKTKPTQGAVRTLNAAGLQPDLIIARSEVPVDAPRKEKISVFCNVKPQDVISAPDVESIYDIPLNFEKEGLGERVLSHFAMRRKKVRDLRAWRRFVAKSHAGRGKVRIGIVGKYFETGEFSLMDSYISVIEAIKHAAWDIGKSPEIVWLSAGDYEKNPRALRELREFSGIIVPGGFGSRGVEGKIAAIRFCRENKIPYFGLCFGMQLAVIEFARNVCRIKGATSREFEKGAEHPVIDVMESQKDKLRAKEYGGTMRLGAYPCKLRSGTLAHDTYKKSAISERHRHRYEVNPQYVMKLSEGGLKFSGVSPDHSLMEIAELPKTKHPFFLGTQFHPELQSRPLAPHPLFVAFLKAASMRRLLRSRA